MSASRGTGLGLEARTGAGRRGRQGGEGPQGLRRARRCALREGSARRWEGRGAAPWGRGPRRRARRASRCGADAAGCAGVRARAAPSLSEQPVRRRRGQGALRLLFGPSGHSRPESVLLLPSQGHRGVTLSGRALGTVEILPLSCLRRLLGQDSFSSGAVPKPSFRRDWARLSS